MPAAWLARRPLWSFSPGSLHDPLDECLALSHSCDFLRCPLPDLLQVAPPTVAGSPRRLVTAAAAAAAAAAATTEGLGLATGAHHREGRELLRHLRRAAVGAGDLHLPAYELLEVRLAAHADELVDGHRSESVDSVLPCGNVFRTGSRAGSSCSKPSVPSMEIACGKPAPTRRSGAGCASATSTRGSVPFLPGPSPRSRSSRTEPRSAAPATCRSHRNTGASRSATRG